MQDNFIKWKYVLPFDISAIENVEDYFQAKIPDDYKTLLPLINSAKPTLDNFDIPGRKACVLDYMHNITDVISASIATGHTDFISFACDPFGNHIGYRLNEGGGAKVYFWDHETDTFIDCALSLSDLIDGLY
ncbi:SMI1 / KNR4 family protein [compost metagenome]